MLDAFNISPENAYALLTMNESVISEDLRHGSYFDSYDSYCLGDGRILLVYLPEPIINDGPRALFPTASTDIAYALLFPSWDVLREQEQEIVSEAERQYWEMMVESGFDGHMLKGRIPQGQDFPLLVEDLIQQLPSVLHLEEQAYEVSWEYLTPLDAAMRRIGYYRCTEDPIFVPLVAYIGELMKQIVGGQWHMEQHRRTGVWEPYILAPDGPKLDPWYPLVKLLLDGQDDPANVPFVAIVSQINSTGERPPLL